MGNVRKGLRMREAGIVIASVMEISLCAMFYDSFMTRFERVHKWHGYLWMAVVGVARQQTNIFEKTLIYKGI